MTMPEFSRIAYLGDLTSDQLDEEARRKLLKEGK